MRKARVMFKDAFAGIIEETEKGYRFTYDPVFLEHGKPMAVEFPLQEKPFESEELFHFFKGLLLSRVLMLSCFLNGYFFFS